MSYQKWLDLFGRNTDNKTVRDALVKVGINPNALEVERDDTVVSENISGEGISLVFTDEAYFYSRDDMAIGEGAPVLSELNLWLLESDDGAVYTGHLPFDLQRDNSRTSLIKRFGVPFESDDDPPWDEWKIENLALVIEYNDDEKSIFSISIELVV